MLLDTVEGVHTTWFLGKQKRKVLDRQTLWFSCRESIHGFLATWLFRKMVSSLSRTPCDLVTQFWRFTFCIILISHFKSSHARPLDFCQQVRMPFFGTTFSSSFCKHVHTCPNMSKHVQTCPNMSKHVQTCPNMSRHVQNMSHKSFTGFTCHWTCHWTCRIRSQECFGISWELALEKDWSFALCALPCHHFSPMCLTGPFGAVQGPYRNNLRTTNQ